MPDDPRVEQLLDELLDSQRTPEEVCSTCIELLPVVRDRWRQICHARAELDALFPPVIESGMNLPQSAPEGTTLPVIPGYEVQAILGLGGMGVVYRARHLRLNRIVALKMALAGSYAGPHERERFQQEAEAVAVLRHPNIVQIYDFGDVDGRPYFTMEYVEGGSLGHKLAGTPQPASQAASILLILAEAVQSAHQAGIVHRDLKPSNVLLTADGTPKVSDFGLARRLGVEAGLTRTGTAVGTPSYMAPEQARGKSNSAGPAVDIYALGAILYELITARPPFLAETTAETVYQLLSRDPVPPSKLIGRVPRDLETICLKCLHKEPRLRYATASALADDLRRFQEGRPINARRLGWAGRFYRWGRRNPAPAVLLATAVTLVVALLGGAWWLERQEADRREETARREGRAWQAVDATLEKSLILQEQGRWPEVRAALEGAQGLLGTSAPELLRERVRQARADAEMVADLEEIRLRLSTGGSGLEPVSLSPERMYADAFQKYGIDLLVLDPAEAADRLRHSAIRETLLAYLHDWLYWTTNETRDIVRSVMERADDNAWRRSFRAAVTVNDTKKLKELAATPEAITQPPVVLSGLSGSLLVDNKREESLALLSESQRRHPGDFWINYLLGHYWDQEQPQKAVGYFRVAVAIRPGSDQAYKMLGKALIKTGDKEEAITAFRKATSLNPACDIARDLAMLLVSKGALEEARVVWGKYLEHKPSNDDSWYGYAQLCLFLDKEEEYRRARQALLDHHENTPIHWIVAERASLACLLLPAPQDELNRIVKLLDQARDTLPKSSDSDFAYIQFVQGLAEYRQGRSAQAIPLLQKSAPILFSRSGPQMALAMAQFQSGAKSDAFRTLATAELAFNWKEPQSEAVPMWVSHILRREAERLILPNLSAFLDGTYQPRNKDERDALLGACQFTNRPLALARLYAALFTNDQQLAKDFRFDHRRHAATSAAKAGCGHDEDAASIGESERAQWRTRAREWLRADLGSWGKTLDEDPTATREIVRQRLMQWRSDPDLAGLREHSELEKLPAEEQKDCIVLWAEVDAMHRRCDNLK